MPYQLVWEKKGIVWKFSGIVTSKEAVDSNMDIYGDARFDDLLYQIADFSQATEVNFTEHDMKKIAFLDQAASRSNPRIKVALVAPAPETRRLLDVYATYASKTPWETSIFDSIEEARQWISVQIEFQYSQEI